MTSLAHLEQLARSATPGRWQAVNLQTHLGIENENIADWAVVDDRARVAMMVCPSRPDNARYIAAASPDVILQLLADRRELVELIADTKFYLSRQYIKFGNGETASYWSQINPALQERIERLSALAAKHEEKP